MKTDRRYYVAAAGISALIFFEVYMSTQGYLSGNTAGRCYPTGKVFPYKDASGNIKYDSVYHTIADFKLTDQNGRIFTSDLLKNKVYVANFFFATCPSICPKMTSQMLELQRLFANDTSVAFLSHTINPEYDSVTVLKKYEKENKINGKQWHLLTGSRKELYDLSKQSYYLGEANDSPENFQHSEKFVLVDNHRVIRGFYDGTDKNEVKKLKFALKQLLTEMKNDSEKENINLGQNPF